MTEIDDKSLLRCTLKKTLHTTERLFVYTAWLIVGGAIALCIAYVGYNGIPVVSGAIDSLCKIVISALSTIPLLAYGIAAIPVGIITYSFLWCIARELTDEDWESDEADIVAAVIVALAAAVAFAAAVAVIAVIVALAAAVAFAVAFAFAAAFAAAAGNYDGTAHSKIFRFVGAAYHHYEQERK